MSAVDGASTVLSCAEDIGLALQQYREKKNISREAVARELRLSVRQVVALESGQFAGFRGAVFVKGYLRACAKLYGVDGDVLVRAYEKTEPQTETMLRSPVATAGRVIISAPDRSGKYGVVALLLLGLAVAVSYWQWTVQKADSSVMPASGASSEQVASSEQTTVAGVADPASEDTMQPVVPTAAPMSSVIPDGVQGVSPVLQSPVSEAAASNADADDKADSQDSVLYMEFSDDCWVRVKNEEGKILHEKNYRKGEVLDMAAPPPLHVWLGRAAAANVSYNGVLVSVPVKPGYQTAQFVLGDDTQSSRVE